MKVKDWQKATQLVHERQTQAATADTSELSSFLLSELLVDPNGPPTLVQGPYVPLLMSAPICVLQADQHSTGSTQDEPSFQQLLFSGIQQSLYPSLTAMGTGVNTAVSPLMPFSRRVINDIEEQQCKFFDGSVEGAHRGTNTFPSLYLDDQNEEAAVQNMNSQAAILQENTPEETLQLKSLDMEDTNTKEVHTEADNQDQSILKDKNNREMEKEDMVDEILQKIQDTDDNSNYEDEEQDTDIQEDQRFKMSHKDNYSTAIDDDDSDDAIQFGSLFTQPFLSRSIRIPTTEVGCLIFSQMFQDYLMTYPPPLQADAYTQIQAMVPCLDVYLSQYLAQNINCMTPDSEFVAFVNHAIQLSLNLTIYPNIWAVLLILLETQDVNAIYIQVMHDYYNQCYSTKIEKYMTGLEKMAEK